MSYRSLWLAVFGASLFVNACIAPTPSTLTTGGPTVAAVNPIVPTTNLTDGCITTYDPAVDYFPEKATLTHSDGFSLEYFKHYKVITVRTPAPGAEPLQFVLVQCGAPTPPGFAETQISQVPVKSIVAMSSTFVTTLDELNLLDRLVGLDEATYISNAKVLQMADAGQLTMIGVGPLSRNFWPVTRATPISLPSKPATSGTTMPAWVPMVATSTGKWALSTQKWCWPI